MAIRHFLTLLDLDRSELNALIERASVLKKEYKKGIQHNSADRKVMAMIFEKSSTRTRVSFEAGMAQLGGHAMFLSKRDTQLGRGEPIEDSSRVISSMVDLVMLRTFGHNIAEQFAKYSSVPVINALTDDFHPCQLLADMQAYREAKGSISGKTVAWIGDGNNMCQSYIHAAEQWDFELVIAAPEGFLPDPKLVEKYRNRVRIVSDSIEAAKNADLLVTDVWASMGQEEEQKRRMAVLKPYQINHDLFAVAKSDAVFMHCLPAHRGEEVSAEIMDDTDRSLVWPEAENRLHAQKALIEFLLAQ
jgi:ornithine carbamoyltransferase